ncbi:MAG: serine hydrolase [Actinocrinis sp.]
MATHTSGLPAVGPSRMAGRVDSRDPWAGCAFTEAEQDLRAATVAPGRPHRYSNLGYQLLGSTLERVCGRSYPLLLSGELFEPLGMTYSGVGRLDDAGSGRCSGLGTLLAGHGESGEVAHWSHPLGAGASRRRSVISRSMRARVSRFRTASWAGRYGSRKRRCWRSVTVCHRRWRGSSRRTVPVSTAAGPAGSAPT